MEHVPGDKNDADHFTKYLPGSTFRQQVKIYYGIDEYDKQDNVLKVMWDLPNQGC